MTTVRRGDQPLQYYSQYKNHPQHTELDTQTPTDPDSSSNVGRLRLLLFLGFAVTHDLLFLQQFFEAVVGSGRLLRLASQNRSLVYLLPLEAGYFSQVLTILHQQL